MRLSRFKLKGFRSYKEETVIDFDDLTVFVGKNDIGKSTILEALDIFFNEGGGTVKPDKNDVNVQIAKQNISSFELTACFSELPSSVIIDETVETSLRDEHMLNKDRMLEVVKVITPGASKPSIKTFIKAVHPSNPVCANLLQKKNKELQKIINDNDIACDNKSINSVMRKAIWDHFADSLDVKETLIDVASEGTREIWGKLDSYLPVYSLFQSDRKNTDSDSEVQDPLKEAVKEIMQDPDIVGKLSDVAERVRSKLADVSARTLEKLSEMDAGVASSLNPTIPSAANLKWADVFKNVSITGDEDIPINKRGSGVKRLILLNFFRAEAEKRIQEGSKTAIIYAIEEPETSQHSKNQKILIEAFKKLAATMNSQVVLTTHSPIVVKCLDFSNLRLICEGDDGKQIINVKKEALNYPSLNEVNYLAFDEVTEEYHDELYGHIKEQGWYQSFVSKEEKLPYNRLRDNGTIKPEKLIKTEIIRNQIHHPENKHNPLYTQEELRQSIENMRQFVVIQNQNMQYSERRN